MPYEVSQLLENIGKPVTATPDESVQEALDRMLHHGFSQLPVVKGDGQNRQFYFITHESILLALHNFGSKVEGSGLRVDDALVRISTVYRMADDLFELLAGMREMNAALIVDDDRNLTHVVTSYDTTRYFRQWAEDIMQVRDVEHGLRSIINSAFKNSDGEINEVARQSAVDEITSSNKVLRKKFNLALKHYFEQHVGKVILEADWVSSAFGELLNESVVGVTADKNTATTDLRLASRALRERFEASLTRYLTLQATETIALDEMMAEDAFKILNDRSERHKEFGELTLGEYIQLFFREECWGRCQDVIRLEREEVQHMLEGVRDTRNELAHFREEAITAQKRMQLRRCADWLSEREKLITAAFESATPA